MSIYPWDIPMYSAATVGRLVGLTSGRVRRWLQGYEYTYSVGRVREMRKGHKEPVIRRTEATVSIYASFLDLIDLLFVKRFLEHGLSLQKVRRALREAEELLGDYHFARRSFFTDGENIYLQVRDNADALLELMSGGQWAIATIIKQLAHQIDFDEPTGFAERWYPLGQGGLVVLDPKIAFGQPTLIGRGITTSNIYDFFLGEGEEVGHVCSWMNLKRQEVEAAVTFERQLAAA
ncbi:MAG: hypothetical protein ACFFCW_38570 [Candidatus Hodarchaeota archaeon]